MSAKASPARLAALFLLLLFTAGCSARGIEALRFLNDIDAGFGASRLKETTPTPERRNLAYTVAERSYAGDLYLSPQGTLAALVLVPGLSPQGKDDPRLVAVAHSLARVRFAVLVPDIASLRALQVGAENVGEIADAALWLSEQPAWASRGKVGIVAISFAVGPALLAALDERARERVHFFVGVGGYYDIVEAIAFFTTGAYKEDGRWKRIEADPYGKWVFVKSNAGKLADPLERTLLEEIAERKLDDPGAVIADLASRLGPDGRAVMNLVENREPERVAALVARLPAEIRDEIAGLDPARGDLTRLAAHVILIHGRADDVIPYTESVALAAALPPGQSALYLVDGLLHVKTELSLSDRLVLWDAGFDILEERDRLAGRLAAD